MWQILMLHAALWFMTGAIIGWIVHRQLEKEVDHEVAIRPTRRPWLDYASRLSLLKVRCPRRHGGQ